MGELPQASPSLVGYLRQAPQVCYPRQAPRGWVTPGKPHMGGLAHMEASRAKENPEGFFCDGIKALLVQIVVSAFLFVLLVCSFIHSAPCL